MKRPLLLLLCASLIPSLVEAQASGFVSTSATNPLPYLVTTVAGTPGLVGFHDGPLDEATFNRPTWLDIVPYDNVPYGNFNSAREGDIYVVDRLNNVVRKISGNRVSTFDTMGSYLGIPGYGALDFGGPFGGGILIEPPDAGCGPGPYDSGLFVASTGSQQVPLLSFIGTVADRDAIVIIGSTLPGSGVFVPPFRTPTGLARSPNYQTYSRLLYIADSGNHIIRRIHWANSGEGCPIPYSVDTLAGHADVPGKADGVGEAAFFNAPRGLATAPDGSLYVADSGNHTIRRIALDGTVTTVAGEAGVAGSNDGPALQAHLNTPSGIDVDAKGEVFITDTGNSTIRMLTTDGMLVTIAGTAGIGGFADGYAGAARFSGPVGLRVASDGTIFVADTSNHVIRRLIRTSAASSRRRATP